MSIYTWRRAAWEGTSDGREDGTISSASVTTDAADAVATDDAQLDATTGNNTTFMVILSDLKIV
jgi:hypothetical protein